MDKLGVPEKIASQLRILKEIMEDNYDRVVKRFLEGRVKYIIKSSRSSRASVSTNIS
jgi:hypothetical protein